MSQGGKRKNAGRKPILSEEECLRRLKLHEQKINELRTNKREN